MQLNNFKNRMSSLLILLFLTSLSMAQKVMLSDKAKEFCTGMYSKRDWSGSTDPFIKVDLKSFETANPDTGNASVSLIIFEYRDLTGIGVTDKSGVTHYECTNLLIEHGYCSESEKNQFIVNSTYVSQNPIKHTLLASLGTNDISYVVTETGYYCVAADSPIYSGNHNHFKLLVNFHNSFGNLPAAEIPKLPLYGLLSVVYAVCLCIYLFQVYRHRSELLLLQKYLAGFFVFLTIENILTWALYDAQNNNKKYPLPGGIKFFIVVVSVFNSFKIAFSLFLLLIIALGYGVVYPKLKRDVMNKCKILAGLYFIVSTAFTIGSYFQGQSQPDATTSTISSSGNDALTYFLLIITIPLGLLIFVFYFFILTSLNKTNALLKETKQIVKLNMYKKLFSLLFVSLLFLVFSFVMVTVLVFNDSLTESIERFWKFDKVLIDFWPSLLYFFIFIGVAIIWRPTDTSYLLAVSSQLPSNSSEAVTDNQDEPPIYNNLNEYGNEFEFDDLRSLESGATNPFDDSHKKSTRSNAPSENPFDDRNNIDNNNDNDDDINFDIQTEQQRQQQHSATNDEFILDDDEEDAPISKKNDKKSD